MAQSIENSLSQYTPKSLAKRKYRQEQVVDVLNSSHRSTQLLSLRREERGFVRSLVALGQYEGVTDPDTLKMIDTVTRLLDLTRERIATLLMWQKPAKATGKQGKADLRPVLDASQLLPEPPAE